MSPFWISAFKALPWSAVIAATPEILKAADTLWGSIKKKPIAHAEPRPATATLDADGRRMAQLEQELDELRSELLSTSGIIKSLAGQNAQLVQAVDRLRRRQTLQLLALVIFSISLLLWAK